MLECNYVCMLERVAVLVLYPLLQIWFLVLKGYYVRSHIRKPDLS